VEQFDKGRGDKVGSDEAKTFDKDEATRRRATKKWAQSEAQPRRAGHLMDLLMGRKGATRVQTDPGNPRPGPRSEAPPRWAPGGWSRRRTLSRSTAKSTGFSTNSVTGSQ
jgi:hypothetical protein